MEKKGYLVLANGKVFEGKRFGMQGTVTGEVVFTTAMGGYNETLTDSGHYGQIVVQTFPLVGNHGVISDEIENTSAGPGGYIVKDWCQAPSNFRSEGALDTFLEDRGIIGLSGIDTRALTRIIRCEGTMSGAIVSSPSGTDLKNLADFTMDGRIADISTKTTYTVGNEKSALRVAVLDFGVKRSIIDNLVERGLFVYVLPYNASAQDIKSLGVNGIVLPNGPGDPRKYDGNNLDGIVSLKLPMLAICTGHLLLALANGFNVSAMKHGHRGDNQPVKDMRSGNVYITSQNHGYVVDAQSVDHNIATPSFVNVNDGTCEGLRYKNIPAVSVQFQPNSGPLDTRYIFDSFISLL